MRVRVRRIAKWGCLSLGVALFVGAVAGCWLGIAYYYTPGAFPPSRELFVSYTGVRFELGRKTASFPGESVARWRHLGSAVRNGYLRGLFPDLPALRAVPAGWSFSVPTSTPALLAFGAGAILWRLDRRRAAHECPKCRYDRRGLAEGAVCPECGAG